MKKIDYSRLTEEQLEEKIKELKYQMIKSQTMMGQVKIKKGEKEQNKGSDILKRLRKEIARIKTELRKRQ